MIRPLIRDRSRSTADGSSTQWSTASSSVRSQPVAHPDPSTRQSRVDTSANEAQAIRVMGGCNLRLTLYDRSVRLDRHHSKIWLGRDHAKAVVAKILPTSTMIPLSGTYGAMSSQRSAQSRSPGSMRFGR